MSGAHRHDDHAFETRRASRGGKVCGGVDHSCGNRIREVRDLDAGKRGFKGASVTEITDDGLRPEGLQRRCALIRFSCESADRMSIVPKQPGHRCACSTVTAGGAYHENGCDAHVYLLFIDPLPLARAEPRRC
jgi:hypothetical protein